MYPPDTYPRTYTLLDTYPPDIYPPGDLPPGHIPPGQIPPRTYTPGHMTPKQISLAQTFETEKKKRSFILGCNLYFFKLFIFHYCALTHSRLTPSFWKCSQGLKDKTPIIDKKAKVPWIILVQKLFQNVD